MRVSAGSKIRNLMEYAFKNLKDDLTRQITWTGSGTGVTKVIHCTEIMKRKIKGLHQVSCMGYKRIEEYWEPKTEGLECMKVNRDIPKLMVLLSKDPLDPKTPGYQPPGSAETFWKVKTNRERPPKQEKAKRNGDVAKNDKKNTRLQENNNERQRPKSVNNKPRPRKDKNPDDALGPRRPRKNEGSRQEIQRENKQPDNRDQGREKIEHSGGRNLQGREKIEHSGGRNLQGREKIEHSDNLQSANS